MLDFIHFILNNFFPKSLKGIKEFCQNWVWQWFFEFSLEQSLLDRIFDRHLLITFLGTENFLCDLANFLSHEKKFVKRCQGGQQTRADLSYNVGMLLSTSLFELLELLLQM